MIQHFGARHVQIYFGINSVTGYVKLQALVGYGLQNVDILIVVRATIIPQHLTSRPSMPRSISAQMIKRNALVITLGGPN